jgi:IS5 family transposase
MRQLLVIAMMLAAATVSHAGITRWVDADGKVHFSDQPPPPTAKSQKTLDIKSSPAAAKTSADSKDGEKSLAEKELESRKRRVEAEENAAKQAKDQEEAKRKKENCTQARNQLQALQSGQRIARYDEKGERVFLEDSARPKAIEEAQRSVDSWCK